jgi:hypothetical protein
LALYLHIGDRAFRLKPSKDAGWEPRKHPRGGDPDNSGRFSVASGSTTSGEEPSKGPEKSKEIKKEETSARSGEPTPARRELVRTDLAAIPEPYTRKGYSNGGGVRVRSDGIPVTASYQTGDKLRDALDRIGADAPQYDEFAPGQGTAFAKLIAATKEANPFGAAVEVKDAADYDDMRLFATPDGTAGFALHGDDIVSLFKAPKGGPKNAVASALALAVKQGGKRLDCFDTVLPQLYSNAGFKAVARLPWNDDYAPPGWSHTLFEEFNEGRPDVVGMVYDPNWEPAYKPGEGAAVTDYDDIETAQCAALTEIEGEKPLPKTTAAKAIPTPEQQRQNVASLTQYLSFIGLMHTPAKEGWRHPADIMLEHGRQFLFDADSYKCKQGRQKECYKNAASAVMHDPDLTYVEGYVTVFGVPIEHAFAVDKQGHVVDPTIRDPSSIGAYIGLPLKNEYLYKTMAKKKVYGVLDPMINPERLEENPADYVKPDIGEPLPTSKETPEQRETIRRFMRGGPPPKSEPEAVGDAALHRICDAAWKEEEHTRGGNPDNTGQFSSAGGSASPKQAKAGQSSPKQATEEEPKPFTREGGLDPMKGAREQLEEAFDDYRRKWLIASNKTDPAAEDYVEQLDRMDAELKPATEAVLREMTDTVGKTMGVDPKRVFFPGGHPTAKVGDKSFNVGGFAYRQTGRIELFNVERPGMATAETLAHEMMHVKFESVRQKRNRQYKDWIEASKKDDPKADPRAQLMTKAGYMTDKAKKQYPLLAAWEEVMEAPDQWKRMIDDDGITEYSREWWKAFNDEKANRDQAIHETFAEMAKLDLEGSLDRLLWFKNSTTWKPLYELINKYYVASEDDRDATWTKSP